MLEGQRIYSIKSGEYTNDKNLYIHYSGGILTITKESNIKAIKKAIKEAKQLDVDVMEYVQFQIDEEGIIE